MAVPGSAAGILLGAGIGAAAATALEPAFEVPRQDAWKTAPYRILDAELIARLVAEGGIPLDSTAYDEAHRQGFADDKLNALIYLSQTVPGVSEAMHLWRLGFIDDALFQHVLVKSGLDNRYVSPIIQTKIEELLGLGDIAIAVVRGILPAPSYVPVPVPAQGDKVPRYPQVNIDPEALAAKIGFSPEALQVMVGRSGLSMAPVMAAQAFFRGIIGPNDYEIAIGEGDLRTEWAAPVREVSRQILSADQAAQLELRGFTDAAGRRALTQQHGMTDANSDNLYNILGRAPAVHAVTTGLARGASYPSDYSAVPDPYRSAIQRSDIRPEFADIVYHDRYSYPSGFQVKAATEAGELNQATAEQLLLEMGWNPKWATFFSTSWAGGSAAAGDKHVSKAETQLWTTTHRSYIAGEIDDATATAALQAAGVAAAAIPAVLSTWQHERALVRKQLSPAQIHKAVKAGVTNPATGQPWTLAEGIAALLARGYDQADAETLLAE